MMMCVSSSVYVDCNEDMCKHDQTSTQVPNLTVCNHDQTSTQDQLFAGYKIVMKAKVVDVLKGSNMPHRAYHLLELTVCLAHISFPDRGQVRRSAGQRVYVLQVYRDEQRRQR